jgi:hypothetical protein
MQPGACAASSRRHLGQCVTSAHREFDVKLKKLPPTVWFTLLQGCAVGTRKGRPRPSGRAGAARLAATA